MDWKPSDELAGSKRSRCAQRRRRPARSAVILVAGDSGGVAILSERPDDYGVAEIATEMPNESSDLVLGSFQISLLSPGGAVAHKNVGRPGKSVLSSWSPFTPVAVRSFAPTTTVSPEMATETPKLSPTVVLEAFR